jgi:hypothetical protein
LAYFKGLFKRVKLARPVSIGDLDLILAIGGSTFAAIELKIDRNAKSYYSETDGK